MSVPRAAGKKHKEMAELRCIGMSEKPRPLVESRNGMKITTG